MSKIRLNLLVDEDYIETLVTVLPVDKVRVIEQNFDENIMKLEDSLSSYKNQTQEFVEYTQSMQELNNWFDGKKSL